MPEDHAVHDLQGERAEADVQAHFYVSLFWQTAVNGLMPAEDPRHLFIAGIPAEAKFSEGPAAFEPFGRIRSLIFLSTKDGTHSGHALLSFHDPGNGVKCLAHSRQLKALSNFFDLRARAPSGT
jgi:hypothetical protein